jgi:hypothetical protein
MCIQVPQNSRNIKISGKNVKKKSFFFVEDMGPICSIKHGNIEIHLIYPNNLQIIHFFGSMEIRKNNQDHVAICYLRYNRHKITS